MNFADRLIEQIEAKNAPACVGLDPLLDRLPPCVLSEAGLPIGKDALRQTPLNEAAVSDALLTFGRGVIDAIASHVPAIKINIAFFERYHIEGLRVYLQLVQYARQANLLVIGDIKRADIGHSATQYATAHMSNLEPDQAVSPDSVTVNPYFGLDGVQPFIDIARAQGRGVFVLVQTSNESAASVQGLTFSDGDTVCQRIARMVEQWASDETLIGRRGYSSIGAVVSPRDLASTQKIRLLMPSCLFLVPGFGAQGRTADEVAQCFKPDGSGAIVTASRSVIYAYQSDSSQTDSELSWRDRVEAGCRDFVQAVRRSLDR